MRKLFSAKVTSVFAVASVFGAVLATSCQSSSTDYTISGKVVGAADGDSVFLEVLQPDGLSEVAHTIVQDGSFSFKGQQDTTAVYYLSCATEATAYSTPIFLDGSKINVTLEDVAETVTGTPNNDAYQEIRGKINDVRRRMLALEADSTLTEEQKNERFYPLDDEYELTYKQGMEQNIRNLVGVFLFKQRFYDNSLAENKRLYAIIPTHFRERDEKLKGIEAMLEVQSKTDATQPFQDFEMTSLDGKPVKLSDYVGKGRPVVIDFWASWCGPCRQAMPELVELYAKYKGKFEIVGVSLDTDQTAWEKAVKDLNITWPQMSDLKGWSNVGAKSYGVSAIPHMVLVDAEGIIVSRDMQAANIEEYLANL